MENLLKNEPVKKVQEFIKKFDSRLEVIVLDTTARTAKDAANSLKCEVGAIVKSLLFKAENNFLICLIAGDRRCSLNKLKKILQKKDVSMANAEEVKKNTGFSIGGVAPVAHTSILNIIVDKSLKRFPHIFAAFEHPLPITNEFHASLVPDVGGATSISIFLEGRLKSISLHFLYGLATNFPSTSTS